MKPMRIAEHIVSVSDFKARASELLRSISTNDQPTVITQNGRPAAVLLSPETYDELTEHLRFVTAVKQGLADAAAGRVHAHQDIVDEMKERFGSRAQGLD